MKPLNSGLVWFSIIVLANFWGEPLPMQSIYEAILARDLKFTLGKVESFTKALLDAAWRHRLVGLIVQLQWIWSFRASSFYFEA